MNFIFANTKALGRINYQGLFVNTIVIPIIPKNRKAVREGLEPSRSD